MALLLLISMLCFPVLSTTFLKYFMPSSCCYFPLNWYIGFHVFFRYNQFVCDNCRPYSHGCIYLCVNLILYLLRKNIPLLLLSIFPVRVWSSWEVTFIYTINNNRSSHLQKCLLILNTKNSLKGNKTKETDIIVWALYIICYVF